MAIFDVGRYMTIDPEIAHGQLTFKGTRVPVSTVMVYLAQGRSVDEIVKDWPQIPRAAVEEAIRMASEALHHRYVVELLAAQDVARRLRDFDRDDVGARVTGG
jgi:uncharacterized protein (DUF433 family)